MRTRFAVPLVAAALLTLPAVPPVATAVPDAGPPQPVARDVDARADSVLVISVDGLTPRALDRLGRTGAPHLHRLLRQGASTRNARTVVEQTTTLPNHTSMVTGRRIDPDHGGHGVTWNDERTTPRTVHAAAGERVASVFTTVDAAGGSSAVFAGKAKFSLWNRSWGRAIDRMTVREEEGRLVRDLRRDLRRHDRDLRFWHVATPDRVGHEHGFMKRRYLRAVRQVDAQVGEVLRTLRSPRLRGRVAVLLTSDHGVHAGRHHDDSSVADNQRVLFVARGPGIARGSDLYALNPGRVADPGTSQPAYDAAVPPVRNADVGNLALDLLGLPAIADSEFNAAQDLALDAP